MYARIGSKTYTRLRNVAFNPQASLLSDEVPINQLDLEIITTDDITVGNDIYLYDDLDQLWCKYWITYAEKIDKPVVKIIAYSKLIILERREMPGRMYSNYPVTDLLATLFSDLGSGSYELDSSFQNATISGYMGHHSKKYRLQLVCFILGATVLDFNSDKIKIIPADNTETLIPINKIFWKPSLKYDDYVTAVSVTAFSYTQGTPETTDAWVEVDDVTYIETTQQFTLANPNVPQTAQNNVVKVEDVQIINSNNANTILNRLASFYFGRGNVQIDVINNREYAPADQVAFYLDSETIAAGRIKSASFRFGLQARSTLEITPVEIRDSAKVILRYTWNQTILRQDMYYFPVGYNYSVETLYVDVVMNAHRYIFRPQVSEATGTVTSGDNVVTIPCDVAVDFYQGILSVYNVDAADVDADELDITENANGITVATSASGSMDMNGENYIATISEGEES